MTEVLVQIPDAAMPVFDDRRYTVLYGGRGSGKSHSVARALLLMAAQEPKRVLCCREVQRSIKDSVHRLLSDCIEAMGLSAFYTVLDTEIRAANGSLFIFSGLSTQTIDSIKSLEGIDLCWVEEAQRITERSWRMLLPTIRKSGSRFILTMNPQLESDPTSQRFLVNPPDGCLSIRMNWSHNPFFPKELEDERLHHLRNDPDTYAHVWEGEHLPAVEGAVYFREMEAMTVEGRIRHVPIDPLLKVHTVWDLGLADSTSIILAQVASSEIRIVGYIQDNNRPLSSYVQELNSMKLNWGDDFVPHDAFARELITAKAPADILSDMGRNPVRVDDMTVEDGIKETREVFPRVFIDSGCTQLIECLKRYRWDVPQNERAARRPVHDEFSHGADSFRYMAICSGQMSNARWGKPIDYSHLNALVV